MDKLINWILIFLLTFISLFQPNNIFLNLNFEKNKLKNDLVNKNEIIFDDVNAFRFADESGTKFSTNYLTKKIESNLNKYDEEIPIYTNTSVPMNIYFNPDIPNGIYGYMANKNNQNDDSNSHSNPIDDENIDRFFNDNNKITFDSYDGKNGNERGYSYLFKIVFAPNIDKIIDPKISFVISDGYRENGTWGKRHQSYDDPDQINIENCSEIIDNNGTTDSEYFTYNDHYMTDHYMNDSTNYIDHGIRMTYDDNQLGTSDILTIYKTANVEGEYKHNNGGGKNYCGSLYANDDDPSNIDKIQENSIQFKGKLLYDKPIVNDLKITKKSDLIKEFSNGLQIEPNKYYWDNVIKDYELLNTNDYIHNIDKINYSYNDISYEDILMRIFSQDWNNIHEEGNIAKNWCDYLNFDEINNNINSQNLKRKIDEKQVYLKYGDLNDEKNLESKITDDLTTESMDKLFYSTDEKLKLNSSQVSMQVKLKDNYIDDLYNNEIIDENGYGLLKSDNFNENDSKILFNIPFYNWTFEKMPEKEHIYKTIFNEDEKFYIDKINLSNDFFMKPNYTINVYTNTNIKFHIENDSNIANVTYNGDPIYHDNVGDHLDNSYTFTTNFDLNNQNHNDIQTEIIKIKYNGKIDDQTMENPVDQTISIKFNYKTDSIVSNNEKNEAVENINDTKDQLISSPLIITKEKNNLFNDIDNSELKIIDYYQAYQNFEFNFTNDELDLVDPNGDFFNEITRYYSSTTGNINTEYLDNIEYKNTLVLQNPGLYEIPITLKNGNTYTYWVSVSKQYVDYDYNNSDELTSNNYIPIEFEDLIDSSVINFDKDNNIYYINIDGNYYYIKNYFETPNGENLLNKGIKKGWTSSSLKKEQSYVIKSLDEKWDKLFDFKTINIDPIEIENQTLNLKQKDKIKFKDIEDLLKIDINNQIINKNNLNNSDFYLDFKIYNSNQNEWVEIPENKIIKNKDDILITINSTKYGIGVNSYTFIINTKMIEPKPMWIKLLFSIIILTIILIISLLSFGIYKRNKNKKIKG